MTSLERILDLLNQNNVSAYQLTSKCELSNSAITDWKKGKGSPSADALIKIADYFNVSLDYLCGRTENAAGYIEPVAAVPAIFSEYFALSDVNKTLADGYINKLRAEQMKSCDSTDSSVNEQQKKSKQA